MIGGRFGAVALALGLCLITTGAMAAPDVGKPIVIGASYDLPSKTLNQTRRINVWLPPGYDAAADKTYPVLYLLDGGEAEDFHHITGVAQVGGMNGYLADMIVVGVAGIDRKHDFTAPSSDPEDRKLLPTSGGSAAFRRFLADELQPYVQARYRTSGRSVLIGESLAGLFVVETFLKQPALFDGYVAISPSLWWDRGSLASGAAAALDAQPPGTRSLYLSVGDEGGGMAKGATDLAEALKTHTPNGLQVRYEPRPQEHHNTIYHPAALSALRWLFPAPAAP